MDHLQSTISTNIDSFKRKDTPFTVILKGLALLERAFRLSATYGVRKSFRPSPESNRSLTYYRLQRGRRTPLSVHSGISNWYRVDFSVNLRRWPHSKAGCSMLGR